MMQKNLKKIKTKQLFLFIIFLTLEFSKRKIIINNIMEEKVYSSFLKNCTKNNLLTIISRSIGENITSVKSIFVSHNIFFGNQFLILNNIIFICEYLGCKKIILDKRYFWYIKNKIKDKKNRRIIEVGNIKDYLNSSTIIDKSFNFFNIYCCSRTNIIRNEILNNLPKITINSKDLFIYVRSGYYGSLYNSHYFQPPLCFYKKIINNFIFRNIILIAKDKTNKIIDILLNDFSFITYKQNPLNIDITYLINAYNLIGVPSSFLYSSLNLNNNLKLFFHYGNHGFYFKTNEKTVIFKMKPSKNYENNLRFWKYNATQIQLMIGDICPYNFEIENPIT